MALDQMAPAGPASSGSGPRNFSEDGALGAAGGTPATPGGATNAPAADPWQMQWGGWNTGDASSMKSMYSSLGENSGKWTKDPTTGQVYDSVNAQGIGGGGAYKTGTSGENASNLAGLNDSMLTGMGDTQDQVNAWDKTMGYAEGGLVTDDEGDAPGGAPGGDSNDGSDSTGGSKWQSMVNDAVSTVHNALSYGYKLHGLSGGASSGLPAGQQDTQAGSAGAASPKYQDFNKSPDVEDRRNNPPMNPASQAVNNFEGKAYELGSRALPLSDQSDNPLSQQAGINDVGDNNRGGIPDEEN